MSLTALLIASLLTFWVESAKVETKLQKMRSATLARSQLQSRLQTLFTNLIPGHPDGSLYTQEFPNDLQESLIILFDHGIDPDPSFSGPVLARLYIDKDHSLSLALWPQDETEGKERAWRKELLLPRVDRLDWEFLGTKKGLTAPEKNKVKIHPVNASYEWRSNWPVAMSETPSLIRLTVTSADKQILRFAFRIPAASAIPTYLNGVKT